MADTLSAAVSASQVIVICVLDNTVTRRLLEEVAGDVNGRTTVNLTSGTPHEARELAAWAVEHGSDYLDGVIIATPPMIGRPEATILSGGSRDAFDSHHAALTAVAPNLPFVGTDPGLPAIYDGGILSLMYATLTGWLQGFALVKSAGVTASTFLPYAQSSFVSVVAAVDATVVAKHVDEGVYPDVDGSSMALNAAGLGLLVRMHEEAGVDASLLEAIRAHADRHVAEGYGSDGFTSLVDAIRRPPVAASP